ncbi:MAG: hypothetical protein E6I87_08260 [Chloroflexi bacterium]|nr:MAG: hypothetical protein E6I87_08260 [Chloroflexota bacterium]
MAENIETEIGVFADETAALRAVRRLEADGIAPERVGVINDPRRSREVVGTRARQLVIPMTLLGAVTGVVLLLLVPGQDAYKSSPSSLVPWAIVGAMAGLLVGALAGKLLPAKDPERYEQRVERGDVLVTVKVPAAERARVRRLLSDAAAQNVREERNTEAP